jgi:WD40 repeat protein
VVHAAVTAILTLSIVSAADDSGGQLAITETSLGKLPSNAVKHSTVISPDGKHLAYVATNPNGKRVVVDGVEGKLYPDIPEVRLSEAGRPAEIRFSPDSTRVAYVASRDKRCFVVVDGVEGKQYESIKVGGIIFSADGKRVAYVATRDGKERVVVDGVEGRPFDYISDLSALFSTDSKTVSYIGVRRQGPDQKNVLVVNGVETMEEDYINSSYPKERGNPPAYVIKRGEKWLVVLNGKPGALYDQIGNNIIFSRDKKHVLYRASSGRDDFIVLDGVEGKRKGSITENSYEFSPDGKVAYVMLNNHGRWVVVGDIENGPYDYVIGEVRFSEDGKRNGFVLERDHQRFAVIDGAEGPKFDDITFDIRFSADGKRYYYVGKRGSKQVVVIDGVSILYDEISGLEFSPDGKRFGVIARAGEKWVAVVDRSEQTGNDLQGSRLMFSPDSRRVAYWKRRGDKQLVAVDGVEGKSYDEITDVTFTPDSRHLTYLADRAGKIVVVVDGTESKEYDRILTGSPFSSSCSCFLAMRADEYLRVEIKLTR